MRLQSSCRLRLQLYEGSTRTEGPTSKMDQSCGCWQEASVPTIWILECPHNMAAGFPQGEWSKGDKVEAAFSFMT